MVVHPEQLVLRSSSFNQSHSATWVAKARDIIEAEEAGTPQFRLGAPALRHAPGGLSVTMHLQGFGVNSSTPRRTRNSSGLQKKRGGITSYP